MTKWILRLAFLAGFIFAGVWVWHHLFPGPEQAIRKQLTSLARTASINPKEGAIAKAARVESFASYFTPDVEILIDMPAEYSQTISGVNELMQVALAARTMGRTVRIEFIDVSIMVAPDKLTAVARMTGEAKISGEQSPQVQELKAHLKKVQRDWLIDRVETVRTLR